MLPAPAKVATVKVQALRQVEIVKETVNAFRRI